MKAQKPTVQIELIDKPLMSEVFNVIIAVTITYLKAAKFLQRTHILRHRLKNYPSVSVTMMYLCVLLVLSVVTAPLATAYPLNFGNYPFDIDYGTDMLDVDVQTGPLCNGARFLNTWPCDRYCNYPVYDYPCGVYPAAYGGYVGGSNIEINQDNYIQNSYYGNTEIGNTRNDIVAFGPNRFSFDQVVERGFPFRRQYPGEIVVERPSVNLPYPGEIIVERERPTTSVRVGGNYGGGYFPFPFLRK